MRTRNFWDNPTEPIHHHLNRFAVCGALKEVTKVDFSAIPLMKWVKSDRHAEELHQLVKDGYRIFLGIPSSNDIAPYQRFAIKGDDVFYVNALYEE